MNDKLFQFVPYLVIGFVVLVVAVVLLRRWLVNVGAREIAIKERRYFGAKMPPGRVVATEGEVGIQADVLKPGLHFVKWPFERVVRKVPLIEIGPDELGIVEAIDGEPMPPGRNFAPDRAQNAHNNFQDPIAFIKQGGVKGIQLRTLPPGLWPIHPYLFRMSVTKATVIPPGKIGVVTAADGAQLDPGRLLAKAIDGHRNFQDAEQFIAANGQKGPQIDILTPGTYYINPFLFKVIPDTAKEVKPGEVAVVVSNTGKDPSDDIRRQMAAKVRERMEREEREQAEQSAARLDKIEDSKTAEEIKQELMTGDPADRRLDEGAHEAYVVPEGYRGIQESVVGPGRYYVNTLAITPIIIPTTNQTVEWTAGEVVNTFNPFEVI